MRICLGKSTVMPALLLGAALTASASAPAGAQIPSSLYRALYLAPDARSVGMGGAFTAIAEGPSAVWWNPGALAVPGPWSAQLVTTADAARWIGTDDVRAYGLTVHSAQAGAALHLLRIGEATTGTAASLDKDYLAQAGAGVNLGERLGLGPGSRVRLGLGACGEYYSFSAHTFSDQTYKRHVIDLDAGGILAARVPLRGGTAGDLFAARGPAEPYAGLRTGVTLRNVLNSEYSEDGAPVGRRVRAGAAVEAGSASWKGLGPALAVTLSAEMIGDMEDQWSSPTNCVGLEVRLVDIVSLRYGEIRDEFYDFHGVARGLGLKLGLPGRAGIALDWASTEYPRYYGHLQPRDEGSRFSGSIWLIP